MSILNPHTVAISLIACLSLVATAARGDERPDLSDPDVLQKILGEAILRDILEERGPEGEKLFYAPDSQTPYTGWAKRMHDNGKVQMLWHGKSGKVEGLSTVWHDNGDKKAQATFEDGKQEGPITVWHENGQKAEEGTLKSGELDGLFTKWHDNGQVAALGMLKNGRPDGLWTLWQNDRQKEEETRYENGGKVAD